MAVEREVFDWGVRLTARPFSGANAALAIKSEIAVYKPGKGSEVRITFTGTSMVSPLRLLDAQAWNEAMSAIIAETRNVTAAMKAEAEPKPGSKKKR
jgi:hypothetical protein